MSDFTKTMTKPAGEDLLVVRNLKKYYPVKTGVLQRVTDHVLAVDDVSFTYASLSQPPARWSSTARTCST